MKNFLDKLSRNKIFSFVMALLAALPPVFMYSSKSAYYWMRTIYWNSFPEFAIALFTANAILMLAYAVLQHYMEFKKPVRIFYIILTGLTVGFTVWSGAFVNSSIQRALYLPGAFAFAGILIFGTYALFIHGSLPKKIRPVVACVLIVALSLTV